MIRLPISAGRIAPQVELTRAERHYLLRVLRLAAGAPVDVFDGSGGRYRALLTADERLELGPRLEAGPAVGLRVSLAQALAKGERMDLIVQKSTELGACAVAPFRCERSVVRLEGARAVERVARWQRIADSASAQCGRADVPEILPIRPLEDVLARAAAEGAQALVLWEKEHDLRLSEAVGEAGASPLVLVVGPEGGLTSAEVARARELKARTVTLGQRILRTETVSLAALAVVQFLMG